MSEQASKLATELIEKYGLESPKLTGLALFDTVGNDLREEIDKDHTLGAAVNAAILLLKSGN